MTTTLADRLLAADDEFTLRCNASTVADLNAARLAALAYAAAWHEVNGAGLRADEADALVRARADLAAMTTERDEAVAHGRAVYDLARSDERKAWQDATGCPTPDDARALRGSETDLRAKLAKADPGAATDACRYLDCSAANLLATVTSLYETRGGLIERLATAEQGRSALRDALTGAEAAARRAEQRADEHMGDLRAIAAHLKCGHSVDAVKKAIRDRAVDAFRRGWVEGVESVGADGAALDRAVAAYFPEVTKATKAPVPVSPLPTPSPRFVAVKRDEVNGRPARFCGSEGVANYCAAFCNGDPLRFEEDDPDQYPANGYPWAVVDTGATPPAALPQVEAFAAARADAANARQIATEACDGWSAAERAHADTVEGEGYEFDRAGAEKPIATLRARLASPEPGADGAKET